MISLVPLFLLASAVRAFPSYAGGASHLWPADRAPHRSVVSARASTNSPEPVAIVDGLKKVPDEDHPFQAPGPTDRRGPCPGLNTLANHGYISRTGIVTAPEVAKGAVEAFNMGADIAGIISIVSVAYDGDMLSGKFSIGAPDNRTAALGPLQNILGYEAGLNYHNTIEGDASGTRQDAYFGDNHSLDPDLYIQMKSIAAKHGGLYTLDTMKEVLQARYDDSLSRNPSFYFLPFEAAVAIGAKGFVSELFSNGTYGLGGVPNEASISSFYGAHQLPDGRYEYVPERFPDNWYRRENPFGLVEGVGMILDIILSTKTPFGANTGRPNSFLPLEVGALTDVNGLACFLRDAIMANVPTMISQPLIDVEEIVSQIVGKITPLLDSFKCPTYNATQAQQYQIPSKSNTYGPPVGPQDQAYGRTSS